MKAVIVGPFGNGTLADEAVLAGLLRHLAAGKHEAVVVSADPARTEELHGVRAIEAGAPSSFLSNRGLWKALTQAHLLILAGGGVISARGQATARAWLALLEPAQVAGLKTAVVGVGAAEICEPKERVRVQRLLHHCAEGLSTRDMRSKQTLMSYGINANRISANGDPALALALAGSGPAVCHGHVPLRAREEWGTGSQQQTEAARGTSALRVGLVLADGLPSREGFGVEPHAPAEQFAAAVEAFVKELLGTPAVSLTLFHDDTEPALAFARQLCAAGLRVPPTAPAERVTTQAADIPPAQIQARMAECSVIVSFSLHGLLLGAGAGVPVAGFEAEPGAADFLASLGLGEYVIPATPSPFDAGQAAAAAAKLLSCGAALRETIKGRMAALRRREAQNARMLDLLVPRRVVYERLKETPAADDDDEESDAPPHKRRPPPSRAKRPRQQ